jgi:hypothetical protein
MPPSAAHLKGQPQRPLQRRSKRSRLKQAGPMSGWTQAWLGAQLNSSGIQKDSFPGAVWTMIQAPVRRGRCAFGDAAGRALAG